MNYNGMRLAFSLVGVPSESMLRQCAFDQIAQDPTPNGSRFVDAMMSVVAHELVNCYERNEFVGDSTS
jgi:hypothetical protein